MKRRVSIVNYGIGNILSVKRAFEEIGVDALYVSAPEQILDSDLLILPGVGAFRNGMQTLENMGLDEAIREYCNEDRPFLGICLGMQMMLGESEEFGITKGLGIIEGKVRRLSAEIIDGVNYKIPHIGWNKLYHVKNNSWKATPLEVVDDELEVYFVHSYASFPQNEDCRLADTFYGGQIVPAVIRKGKCYGMQFHPEKSGKTGLNILRKFVETT